MDPLGKYTCTCLNGYTGVDCETRKKTFFNLVLICKNVFLKLIALPKKALPCDLNSKLCLNGGSCENNNEGEYSCACANGYTGDNCETRKIYSIHF